MLDTMPEIVVAGIVVLGLALIIWGIIKMIIRRGGKLKIKGMEISEDGGDLPCMGYVKEHSDLLAAINETLSKMEAQREDARKENSESNKITLQMIRHILTCQDAMLEALQKSNIGNGNIEKARKSIALCYDARDQYLVDQL